MGAPAGARGAQPEIPRRVLVIGVPLAGAFLFSLFLFLGFPYDRLGEFVAAELLRSTGVRVVAQEIGPSVGFAGPAIAAEGVRVHWPDGPSVALDRARLRPAWSLAWLRGRPAIHADLVGPIGALSGTFTGGGEPAWSGSLRGVELSRLPLEKLLGAIEVDGVADAEASLALGEAGPIGELTFEASDGSVFIPDLRYAVPYAVLRGELHFREEVPLEVVSLELEGPMLNASLRGSLGEAARLENAPLHLELSLQLFEPGLRESLRAGGVHVGADGSAELRISGTQAQPRVQ